MKKILQSHIAMIIAAVLFAPTVVAQTTSFTYQGFLNDGAGAANGSYQFRFELYDAAAAGTKIGNTITDVTLAVSNGVFGTTLDLGASAFSGEDRYLEIAVRNNAQESYVTLNPRQKIASSPYSIRTLSAAQADVALDSQKLGGIDASEYVTSTAGPSFFIRNDTKEVQTADFNITGNGRIGGNFGIGTQNPNSKLDVRGNLTLDNGADPVLYTGTAATEQNRFLSLINSPTFPSGSGLKASGALIADSYEYANPGKNNLIVKGNVGIGLPNPAATLDVFGSARVVSSGSGHMIAQTTGDVNSWARYYMRTQNQSWLMGTSRDFNGNQFYLVDETGAQTRMSIQPFGGAITFPFGNVGIGSADPTARLHVSNFGNTASAILGEINTSTGFAIRGSATAVNSVGVRGDANAAQGIGVWGQSDVNTGVFGVTGIGTGVYGRSTATNGLGRAFFAEGNAGQTLDKGGFVKAMLFVKANGIIDRCYNGITNVSLAGGGTTPTGCGFTVIRNSSSAGPTYDVNFGSGFNVASRYLSLTSISSTDNIAGRAYYNSLPTFASARFFTTNQVWPDSIDSDFIMIVF